MKTLSAILALSLTACGASTSTPTPDPTQAFAAACERASACVVQADAGLPVSPAFCENEYAEQSKTMDLVCDQATLDDCVKAIANAPCDAIRNDAAKVGDICYACFVPRDAGP